jgi:DNA polymerase-4
VRIIKLTRICVRYYNDDEAFGKGMYIMNYNHKRLIFHIDVNSAYLSWEAVNRLQHGEKCDLREVPSVVGGDPITRHGIVLAKSTPAKKFKIATGETIYSARQKCPELVIVPPHYDLYMKCSSAMQEILYKYTPEIQRFSIDESFLDFSNMEHLYPNPIEIAYEIKDRIKNELGFTVNIGISSNKLLAKMAGELKKPDMVHTLFPEEIKDKMWPLPVQDLFMVGRSTLPKLIKLNIFTIGDLANYDLDILKTSLKSHGELIWRYANGIDDSQVRKSNHIDIKGIGNSTTISFDVEDRDTAHKVILSLSEMVGMRLRDSHNCCRLVSVSIRSSEFMNYSHQRKLYSATDNTKKIAKAACELFDAIWKGEAIRHLGVRVSELCTNEYSQSTLFDDENIEKDRIIDKTIDDLRQRFGARAAVRAVFIHSGIKGISGGVGEEEYPVMTSIL